MVFIVRPKVNKELKSYLHKPTTLRAVIPIAITSNYIFCTSLLMFTALRESPRSTQFCYHTDHQLAYLCSNNAAGVLPRNTLTHLPEERIGNYQGGGASLKVLGHLLFLKGIIQAGGRGLTSNVKRTESWFYY